jgi:porphobilinogen synthase
VSCAADAGLLDKKATMLELLTAIKRAGAGIIITYFAKEAARKLAQKY